MNSSTGYETVRMPQKITFYIADIGTKRLNKGKL